MESNKIYGMAWLLIWIISKTIKSLIIIFFFLIIFPEMKIIKVKPSAIAKVRNLGAKIVNCYITPLQHKSYEGKKKNQEDYLYAVKAYCDNCILIAFTSKQ